VSTGALDTYALVAASEANADGRVSVDAPLGRALVGCRAGDRVTVQTARGRTTLVVIDVDREPVRAA
jgi:transcription elongation factor GreA